MLKVVIRGVNRVQSRLRKWFARIETWPADTGARVASVYLGVLQANCPVVTGVTRDRIRIESVDSSESHYKAILSLPAYLFIIPGTVIEPVHAKALYFYWERVGKFVFFSRVTHPGVGGGPEWIYDSLGEARNRLPAIIRPDTTMIFEAA